MPRLFLFSYMTPMDPQSTERSCYVMAQITASHIATLEKAQQAMDEMSPAAVEVKLNCNHWMMVEDESLWPSESLSVPMLSEVGIDGRTVARFEMSSKSDADAGLFQSKPIEIKGLLLAYQATEELDRDTVYTLWPDDSSKLTVI